MAPILVLLEGSSIFALTAAALWILAYPVGGGWGDFLKVLVGAGGLSLSVLLAFYSAGLYDPRVIRSFEAFLGRVPRALAAALSVTLLVALTVPAVRSLGTPAEFGVPFVIGIFFGPVLLLRAAANRLMHSRRFVRRLLIVGTSLLAWQLIEEIHARADCRYAVAGVAGGGAEADGAMPPEVPGSLAGLDVIIDRLRPDEIVVALSHRRGQLPVRELLDARVHRGIPVHDGVALFERLAGKLPIEALASSHLIFSGGFGQSPLGLGARRSVSVLVAALGLVVAAPLLGLIALAIKLDSPGPVFFAQRRVGFRGKPFTLLKFRTMRPVEHPPSEWERDNGHRITLVGRWLRRFWLDELPQLVNILRGDMDLVGPRPHPVCNADLFTQKIPYYALRTAVRPGLTGWAQVRYGYANDLDEEAEKMCYDLYYMKHRSFWLDLRILLGTMRIVLSSRDRDAADHRAVDARRIAFFPTPVLLPADGDRAAPAGAEISAAQLDFELTREPSPR